MNIAYFRTSQHDANETVRRLKSAAEERGFSVLGASPLPSGNATVLTICKPEWAQVVVDADPNLIGLLPCAITVVEKDGATHAVLVAAKEKKCVYFRGGPGTYALRPDTTGGM